MENEMKPVRIGDIIPHFALPDQYGNIFDINSVLGIEDGQWRWFIQSVNAPVNFIS
jgi:hypothetical protein